MCSSKCEKIMANSMMGAIPEPPKEIEALLDEYQDFLGSVFAREYEEHSSAEAMSMHSPKLTNEEQKYIETLTKKLHSSQGWKDYIKMCKQWAVMM